MVDTFIYVTSASIYCPLFRNTKIFQILYLGIIFVKCLHQICMKPHLAGRCLLRIRCKDKEDFRINKEKLILFSKIYGL